MAKLRDAGQAGNTLIKRASGFGSAVGKLNGGGGKNDGSEKDANEKDGNEKDGNESKGYFMKGSWVRLDDRPCRLCLASSHHTALQA
jgi:hypothetical protein